MPAAHCLHLPTLGMYTVNVISEKEEIFTCARKKKTVLTSGSVSAIMSPLSSNFSVRFSISNKSYKFFN